jgi:hypothetical protein
LIWASIRRGEVNVRDATRLLIAFILDGCGEDATLLNEVKTELSQIKYIKILPIYTSILLGCLTDWEINQASMHIVGLLNLDPELRLKVLNSKTANVAIRARLGDKDSEKSIIRLFEWRMDRNDDYRLDLDVSAANELLIANTTKTRDVFFEKLRSTQKRKVQLTDRAQLLFTGEMPVAYIMLTSLASVYPNSGLIPVTDEERAQLENPDKMKAYKQRVAKTIFELEHEAVELHIDKIFVLSPELNYGESDEKIIIEP